jgi:acyl-coenzyme A synthetase/AMP-(fatty) acid ligase
MRQPASKAVVRADSLARTVRPALRVDGTPLTGTRVAPGRLRTLAKVLEDAPVHELGKRWLSDAAGEVRLDAIAAGSCFAGQAGQLRGRSVLIYATDQLHAALALMELDGVARSIVLCPPDLVAEHLPHIIALAKVDAVVSQRPLDPTEGNGLESFVTEEPAPVDSRPTPEHETEWILLTSGTTGLPKLVAHNLTSLAGAIQVGSQANHVVWSTFYDIRRYGGLQIFLRAILTGASLVLCDAGESTADFLTRAAKRGVTHISGTPSHWRRALMSPSARAMSPEYVRLSGEIADQAVLASLHSTYPEAHVAHAFASTEAGLAFEVNDGLEGVPASFIGAVGEVEMKVEDGSLRVRSPRIASRYLGGEPLTENDGFVDTHDMLELRGDRYYFVGRRDGVINIGGMKVHPEEVETVINRHPRVRMSLVYTRKNPITGAIVVADVVLKPDEAMKVDEALKPGEKLSPRELQSDILRFCRKELPSHKVPAAIKIVPALQVSDTGKLTRKPCAT